MSVQVGLYLSDKHTPIDCGLSWSKDLGGGLTTAAVKMNGVDIYFTSSAQILSLQTVLDEAMGKMLRMEGDREK